MWRQWNSLYFKTHLTQSAHSARLLETLISAILGEPTTTIYCNVKEVRGLFDQHLAVISVSRENTLWQQAWPFQGQLVCSLCATCMGMCEWKCPYLDLASLAARQSFCSEVFSFSGFCSDRGNGLCFVIGGMDFADSNQITSLHTPWFALGLRVGTFCCCSQLLSFA